MFSNFNFFDYVIILSGLLLCFKRVAEMERYHLVRVVVLTSILSFFVILFFGFGLTFGHDRDVSGSHGNRNSLRSLASRSETILGSMVRPGRYRSLY